METYTILHWARTTYAGFNDPRLCEKNSVSWKASLSGAREATKAWRPAPENLDRICCFLHQRSVGNDNVVPGDGRRLPIPPQPHRFSFAGAKVQLYESLHGYIAIYYGETKLLHSGGKVQSRGGIFIGPLG